MSRAGPVRSSGRTDPTCTSRRAVDMRGLARSIPLAGVLIRGSIARHARTSSLVYDIARTHCIAMVVFACKHHDGALAEGRGQLGDKALSILVDEDDRRGLAAFLHHGPDVDALRVIGLSVMKDVDRELAGTDDQLSLMGAL